MELNLIKSTVGSPSPSVNPQEQIFSNSLPETPTPTQLVPVLLKRGDRETFFHVPTCYVCSKPIIDFEAANVVVLDSKVSNPKSLESLGTIDGAEMLRLPGRAVAVHFGCDQHGWTPWIRSSSVFCRDQRGPIEKLTGWSGEVGRD
jgi:hypothetical protein